eukprot:4652471-Lingulodinium_polyedra.AAC.1
MPRAFFRSVRRWPPWAHPCAPPRVPPRSPFGVSRCYSFPRSARAPPVAVSRSAGRQLTFLLRSV